MPVNSFENYLLTWKPAKSRLKAPLYQSIASCLEQDIRNGDLPSNAKLPPQRELADFLDVNLSTITRAYKICQNRGLIYATTGKGTFVSPGAAIPASDPNKSDSIDLGIIKPYYQFNTMVADVAGSILGGSHAGRLFEFHSTLGEAHHQRAARKWLAQFHMEKAGFDENIILTSGTQNAFVIALLALFKAGDKIAVDPYTYPNFKKLANQLQIQLVPIEADDLGMQPDMLEKQCRIADMKGVYLMPSCSNPTSITIPQARREMLAKIISQYNLILIEDDAYGFISDNADYPMAAIIPDNAIYLQGTSKSLSPGLRIAYMIFPGRHRTRIINTANNVNLKVPLLNAEIATELIASGAADEITARKKILAGERSELYRKYFPDCGPGNPLSLFKWLPLPAGLDGYDFELQAQKQNVQVLCSERFAIGKTGDASAIRLAVCSPASISDLEKGLQIISHLITESVCAPSENFIV